MLRSIALTAALGVMMFGAGSADAATYCARFKGGPEMATGPDQCTFASLQACRDAVRARGGGRCYKKGQMR